MSRLPILRRHTPRLKKTVRCWCKTKTNIEVEVEIMPWPEQTKQADEISPIAQGVALEGKQEEYELSGNNLQDNVIRAANENTPQESRMDEDDQNDSVVTEVEWMQCAGQIGSLVTYLNKLKKDLENSEVPNPEKFLVEAKDMVMCCRDMLIKLEENIGAALAKLQNEGPPVTEKDLYEPVPSDPGLRPTPLSDSQRLYLAQLGPQQPILSNYPRNKDITTSHKQNSFCSTSNDFEKTSAVYIGSKFNIYRRDRLSAGGGVLAYVNTNIPIFPYISLPLCVLWEILTR